MTFAPVPLVTGKLGDLTIDILGPVSWVSEGVTHVSHLEVNAVIHAPNGTLRARCAVDDLAQVDFPKGWLHAQQQVFGNSLPGVLDNWKKLDTVTP